METKTKGMRYKEGREMCANRARPASGTFNALDRNGNCLWRNQI